MDNPCLGALGRRPDETKIAIDVADALHNQVGLARGGEGGPQAGHDSSGLADTTQSHQARCYVKSVEVKSSLSDGPLVDGPPTKLRKVFAENVRRLRKAAGLSQEAFADACGLHRTYIGSIERAERNVSLDNIERIAGALGVGGWELLRQP